MKITRLEAPHHRHVAWSCAFDRHCHSILHCLATNSDLLQSRIQGFGGSSGNSVSSVSSQGANAASSSGSRMTGTPFFLHLLWLIAATTSHHIPSAAPIVDFTQHFPEVSDGPLSPHPLCASAGFGNPRFEGANNKSSRGGSINVASPKAILGAISNAAGFSNPTRQQLERSLSQEKVASRAAPPAATGLEGSSRWQHALPQETALCFLCLT